ncbi:hypothetical protein [Escherichia coli]|uniref:hypothetical protein n=2 Tax=Enterobacteriaceae TaxID=543 RepID=UPI000BE8997F|nr:hypothetical protein [Escherichia coli]
MEYTINFFHNLDDILKGTHLRLIFVAIIGFAIFMKGIRHVINDFPVLVSYYKRAKREGYTDFQFFINNAHNIGMYLLVLFATLLSAYAIYFLSLIHILSCRRSTLSISRRSPYN